MAFEVQLNTVSIQPEYGQSTTATLDESVTFVTFVTFVAKIFVCSVACGMERERA